jgi:restriction system protein
VKLAAEKKAKHAASLTSPGKQPTEGLVYESDSGADDSGWIEALLQVLRTMDPAAFERLAQRLLRESGFVKVEVTGKSGDGGIDGSGVLRMNLISFQVLFQCKRYQGSVSAGTVRDFRGAMQGRADKGLIITTANFTAEARKEATRDGAPSIDLIDGESLCQLLKEKELGVRVRPVVTEEVTILPEFFDEI